MCIVGLGGPEGTHAHLKHATNIMITQSEYVEGCQQWYKEANLQPGNPEDGEWQECHYPVPKCLKGTEIVLMLKEHHAVQGVLQSEEYQHPCIWGWEGKYLQGEYLELFIKWRSELGRLGASMQSSDSKRKGWEGMMKTMTPDKRAASIRKQAKTKSEWSEEKKNEVIQKVTRKLLEANPDHFSDMAKKAREVESQEVRSARGHAIPSEAKARGRAVTNSIKYRCTVTGHVSTAGPLTRYQQARGIDPVNRERVG